MAFGNLPIYEVRDELATKLREQRRFVLRAPTGSGKSTCIPQFLIDDVLPQGEVVILQPRRIAARMLAKRVAEERGTRLGEEVGYQVRFDNHTTRSTRIRFVTEGILMRQMLEDNRLGGVSAILFDEFHERHLYGDISLALALRIQKEQRPDLIIGVMSATLDHQTLAEYLAPCAEIHSDGRTFPVEISYAGGGDAPVWENAARQWRQLARETTEGDFLIFMPGAFEIHKTLDTLRQLPEARDYDFFPLYGDLPPEQQDAAMYGGNKRRVIVSTNVAETSLTIEGVTVVIDSGLARIPDYDPNRGINTLLVSPISRASADQRAGRAGRTAPGHCVRLWTKTDHQHRPASGQAEIHRLDLSEILLNLAAAGIKDFQEFPWFEKPAQEHFESAIRLLKDLGALTKDGHVTEVGKKMAAFPAHPRYARLLIAGAELGCLEQAAIVVALAQGKDILLHLRDKKDEQRREDLLLDPLTTKSDFLMALKAFDLVVRRNFDQQFCRENGIHGVGVRTAAQVAQQLLKVAHQNGLSPSSQPFDETNLRKAILAGFSDHVAMRLDRGTLRCELVHGRRGELRRQTVVRDAPLVVAGEVEERNLRGDVSTLLGAVTEISEEWLRELFPQDFEQKTETLYDPQQKKVVSQRRTVFRGLVLDSTTAGEPDKDVAASLLAKEIVQGNFVLKGWTEKIESWIRRLNVIAKSCPDLGFPELSEEDRELIYEQFCYGCYSYKELREKDAWPHVRDWLSPEQRSWLDTLAPETLPLPNGKPVRLEYDEENGVTLSATVQQLYDSPDKYTIAEGRITVKVALLAPNRRPVQVTTNLGEFWKNSYEEVKKQLKGRYPKHEWR